MINESNWGHCFLKNEDLKVFISLGGRPTEDGARVSYCVTLTDLDHVEVFQNEFDDLSIALNSLNKRYGHWEFNNAEVKPACSGCDTCDNK